MKISVKVNQYQYKTFKTLFTKKCINSLYILLLLFTLYI